MKIEELNEHLRKETGVSKRQLKEWLKKVYPVISRVNKTKRNELCPCWSGKKFKKCCWLKRLK